LRSPHRDELGRQGRSEIALGRNKVLRDFTRFYEMQGMCGAIGGREHAQRITHKEGGKGGFQRKHEKFDITITGRVKGRWEEQEPISEKSDKRNQRKRPQWASQLGRHFPPHIIQWCWDNGVGGRRLRRFIFRSVITGGGHSQPNLRYKKYKKGREKPRGSVHHLTEKSDHNCMGQ